MALSPGARLGPYEVTAQIGVGGMGEVYKATDTNLKRAVAIKVLPASVAGDPERLARFEREATTLASLNHPNIAAIYGFEKSPSTGSGQAVTHALVMELVEGEDLSQRIARGAIPLDEALAIARQIADALEAAHEQGIIHRDLKPANIKVRADGAVKVLDFGLAKAMEPIGAMPSSVSLAPTITTPALMTGVGTILGTAAYMSPEQAKGRPADKRSDVWSFGCVLYEMLTGRRAFSGQTVTETLAAILERDLDLTKLPASTPASIRILLRRALEREPRRRLHDIADARLELDDNARADTAVSGPSPRAAILKWIAALGITAIATGGAVWYLAAHRLSTSSTAAVTRLIVVPEGPFPADAEGVVTLSPDGRRLVYVAARAGQPQLYLRELDQFEGKPIAGTEGAASPVFSPDGNWLAFSAGGKVKKVAVTGGVTTLLEADTEGNLSLSWESNDTLFFRPARATGIWRVPAAGGTPTPVTTLQDGEISHVNPAILPGGKALLYAVASNVFAQSLGGDQQRRKVATGSAAQYLPTGHLVYVAGGTLFAVPFDAARLEVRGNPTAVLQGIRETPLGAPQLTFSETGTMAYVAADSAERRSAMVWVDRTGAEQTTFAAGLDFSRPRLAPDGRRVAVVIGSGAGQGQLLGNVWLFDLTRETRTPLTFDGRSTFPVWSPDGSRLAYSSGRGGRYELLLKTFSGAGADEMIPSDRSSSYPLAWSPDGRFVASVSVDPVTANDIWVLPVGNPSQWRPFVQTRFGEGGATFSPDGRWIAYASAKSGRTEIYMRPFPGPGEEVTLSTGGGNEPMWARKSGELFYRTGDEMMVIDIATTPAISVGKPRRLFEKPYNRTNGFWSNYDVAPDGRRLLMVKGVAQEAPGHINVVLNWFEELKRLVPTN